MTFLPGTGRWRAQRDGGASQRELVYRCDAPPSANGGHFPVPGRN